MAGMTFVFEGHCAWSVILDKIALFILDKQKYFALLQHCLRGKGTKTLYHVCAAV